MWESAEGKRALLYVSVSQHPVGRLDSLTWLSQTRPQAVPAQSTYHLSPSLTRSLSVCCLPRCSSYQRLLILFFFLPFMPLLPISPQGVRACSWEGGVGGGRKWRGTKDREEEEERWERIRTDQKHQLLFPVDIAEIKHKCKIQALLQIFTKVATKHNLVRKKTATY